MIKGIGVDAVAIERIKGSLLIEGFKESVFTDREIENEHGYESEYYASRLASKEAVYKAVSRFFQMDLRTIETLNRPDGSPVVTITDKMKKAGINDIHITITTELGMAIVYCVVE